MFYLVDQDNVLVKKHEKKSNLRRALRSSDDNASLRIIEGKTLKAALNAEAKAKEAPKKEAKVKAPKKEAKAKATKTKSKKKKAVKKSK